MRKAHTGHLKTLLWVSRMTEAHRKLNSALRLTVEAGILSPTSTGSWNKISSISIKESQRWYVLLLKKVCSGFSCQTE